MGLLRNLLDMAKAAKVVERSLSNAEESVNRINQRLETTMATLQNFKDLLAAVNTETDRIAAKAQTLLDHVSDSGLTGPEEEEILAEGAAIVARLKSVGADPQNPIPEEPTA